MLSPLSLKPGYNKDSLFPFFLFLFFLSSLFLSVFICFYLWLASFSSSSYKNIFVLFVSFVVQSLLFRRPSCKIKPCVTCC